MQNFCLAWDSPGDEIHTESLCRMTLQAHWDSGSALECVWHHFQMDPGQARHHSGRSTYEVIGRQGREREQEACAALMAMSTWCTQVFFEVLSFHSHMQDRNCTNKKIEAEEVLVTYPKTSQLLLSGCQIQVVWFYLYLLMWWDIYLGVCGVEKSTYGSIS